jgi:formate dehydrogenase iron-sulfur subunit
MTQPASGGDAFGLLVDVTRCTGCADCVAACAEEHGVDPQQALLRADRLAADRRCSVQRIGQGRFVRKSCMHCVDPSCVAACLVGGLTKSPEGPVVYDADRCIGCRYCMLACPFRVPRYEWDRTLPFMRKCTMCHERLGRGQRPACVEACPHDALSFGPRSRLLAEAHARIESDPQRYLTRVWGEDAWGGTSVLYVSDVDLTSVGFGGADDTSIPEMTAPVLHATPYLAFSVAVTTGGLRWIVRRRQKLMGRAESDEPQGEDDA